MRMGLEKAIGLPNDAVSARGSHLTHHGAGQQSLTFVRPHGGDGKVSKKALEKDVVRAIGGGA